MLKAQHSDPNRSATSRSKPARDHFLGLLFKKDSLKATVDQKKEK